jgi:hypothetical protein
MPKPDAPPPLPEDRAGVLFMAMDVAQARGENARAADLQSQLRELGWVVTRRRVRQPAPSRTTCGGAVAS